MTGWTGGQRAVGDIAPALAHYTAFYTGWPRAMAAIGAARAAFADEET